MLFSVSLEVRVRELEEELQKAHQTIANLSMALSESTGYQNLQIQWKLDLLIEKNGKEVMEMVKMQNESHYILIETLEKRLEAVCGKPRNDTGNAPDNKAVPPQQTTHPLPPTSVDSLIKKVTKLQAAVDRIEGPQKDAKDRLIVIAENIESIKKTVGDFGGRTAVQPTNQKVEEELNVLKTKLDDLKEIAKNSDNALMQQLKCQLGTDRKKSEKNSQLITQMHSVIKDIGTERTKQKETENRVTKILQGPLASFQNQVIVMNDKVRIGERIFDLNEFEFAMQSTPWTVFPDGYDTECWECEGIFSLECLWDDGVSAYCPKCKMLTLLQTPKQGHEWMYFSECFHHEEVKLGSRPPKCGVCARAGPCEGIQEAVIRIPEKSRKSKCYYNRYGIDKIVNNVDVIKNKIRISETQNDEPEEEEAALIDETMITCAICCEIFHRPVSINPCNHKFCAGCIYQWLASSATCPTCRTSATFENISPDAFVSEVADKFLTKFPARKRAPSILGGLDEHERSIVTFSHAPESLQGNTQRRGFFGW